MVRTIVTTHNCFSAFSALIKRNKVRTTSASSLTERLNTEARFSARYILDSSRVPGFGPVEEYQVPQFRLLSAPTRPAERVNNNVVSHSSYVRVSIIQCEASGIRGH
jgi:hypothetical protein